MAERLCPRHGEPVESCGPCAAAIERAELAAADAGGDDRHAERFYERWLARIGGLW